MEEEDKKILIYCLGEHSNKIEQVINNLNEIVTCINQTELKEKIQKQSDDLNKIRNYFYDEIVCEWLINR